MADTMLSLLRGTIEGVIRTCPVCSGEYVAAPGRLRHDRQTTCSRACSYARRGAISSAAKTGVPSPLKGVTRGQRRTAPYPTKPCQVCDKPIEIKERARLTRTKFCSKECFYAGRELKATFPAGAAHPSYVDGTGGTGYTPEFSPALKRRVRERDGYCCQLCGITEDEHRAKYRRALAVNHIDFDKTNCAESNLNTLCIGCNTRINYDRPRWTAHFQARMVQRAVA